MNFIFNPTSKKLFQNVVLFSGFLLLASCDQPSKTNAPAPTPNEPQAQLPEPKKPEQLVFSRELLTRGTYALDFENWQNLPETEAILRDLFEGMTAYDAQGNVIPALAQSWQTQDNKSWLFELRNDAKWSNGESLSAPQIVQHWQNLARSENPQKRYLAYMNVQNAQQVLNGELPAEQLKITAQDEHKLLIELDKPTPFLPAMLAHVSQLIRHPNNPKLANGAYQLAEQNAPENHLWLTKNPYYWAQEKVAFKQVDYQKLQPAQPLQGFDVVLRPQTQSEQIQNLPRLCSYFYLFNQNKGQLAKKVVRKALVRNEKSLLPSSLQQIEDNFEPPAMLEELLHNQQIDERHPLKLQLAYEQNHWKEQLAQQLIRSWSESDLIQASAQPREREQLLQNYAKGQFDLIGTGWCADYNDPSAFLSLFYSQSPDNKTGYHNAQFDQLLEKALNSKNATEQQKFYQQAESLLQKDYVAIPLHQYKQPVYLNSEHLQGYDLSNPVEVIYSKDLFRKVEP